jgi:hypothetical protein
MKPIELKQINEEAKASEDDFEKAIEHLESAIGAGTQKLARLLDTAKESKDLARDLVTQSFQLVEEAGKFVKKTTEKAKPLLRDQRLQVGLALIGVGAFSLSLIGWLGSRDKNPSAQ